MLDPSVTLIKKCPFAMDRGFRLCRSLDTNEKALLLVEVFEGFGTNRKLVVILDAWGYHWIATGVRGGDRYLSIWMIMDTIG